MASIVRSLVRGSIARSLVVGSGGGSAPITQFITNGGFDGDGSPWGIVNAGWTISGGVATCINAFTTRLLVEELAGTMSTGSDYVLSLDVVTANPGAILVCRLGDGFTQSTVYADTPAAGPLVVPYTADIDATGIRFYCTDDTGIQIDNVSLVPA